MMVISDIYFEEILSYLNIKKDEFFKKINCFETGIYGKKREILGN